MHIVDFGGPCQHHIGRSLLVPGVHCPYDGNDSFHRDYYLCGRVPGMFFGEEHRVQDGYVEHIKHRNTGIRIRVIGPTHLS